MPFDQRKQRLFRVASYPFVYNKKHDQKIIVLALGGCQFL